MIAPGIALPVAGLFVGAAIVWQQAVPVWRGLRAARWPRVDGRVVDVSLSGIPLAGPGGFPRGLPGGAVPLIEYEYSVGGQHFRSNRVSFGGFTFNEAVETAAMYKRGKHVQVAYDPHRPDQAVLDTGPDLRALLYVGIGGVVLYLSAHALLTAP